MAKRGRPSKAQGNCEKTVEMLEKVIEGLRRQLIDHGTVAEKMIRKLTKERDEAKQGLEDRFISSQALAKQLVQAEDRSKELLAEIRMYEHETSTLRHIIIDGLRGYDR